MHSDVIEFVRQYVYYIWGVHLNLVWESSYCFQILLSVFVALIVYFKLQWSIHSEEDENGLLAVDLFCIYLIIHVSGFQQMSLYQIYSIFEDQI